MLSGPTQGIVDNGSVTVPLVSAHQAILSSPAHSSWNVELITTNLVSMPKLMFVLLRNWAWGEGGGGGEQNGPLESFY